ncbi:MAG: EamA family transporter [bacterium]|nr:EamA family transporter [bacterium]
MIPFEVVTLVSTFFFTYSSVLMRQGLDESTPHTGSLIVLMTNGAAFMLAIFWVDFSQVSFSWYWAAFAGADVASPALSLFFMYRSISHLGVAPTTSLLMTHAFFGPFIAYFLLGERPHPVIWLGIAIVLLGVFSLTGGEGLRDRRRYIVLPILSGLSIAVSNILQKVGVGGMDSLLLGGFLQGASAAVIGPFLLKAATGWQPFMFNKSSLRYFFFSGLSLAMAMFTLLYALRGGRVSLISPILATGPLFALALTRLFLHKKEKITLRIAGGATLIVAGVLLVMILK